MMQKQECLVQGRRPRTERATISSRHRRYSLFTSGPVFEGTAFFFTNTDNYSQTFVCLITFKTILLVDLFNLVNVLHQIGSNQEYQERVCAIFWDGMLTMFIIRLTQEKVKV